MQMEFDIQNIDDYISWQLRSHIPESNGSNDQTVDQDINFHIRYLAFRVKLFEHYITLDLLNDPYMRRSPQLK